MLSEAPWSFYRSGFLLCLWSLWIVFVPLDQKLLAFCASNIFAVIELIFTGIKYGKPKTTFAQYWIALLVFPVISPVFRTMVNHELDYIGITLRIIFFPLFMWIVETIEGYILIVFYGNNPAWDYSDSQWSSKNRTHWRNGFRTGEDSYFHGNIKIKYYMLWWILGIITEVAFIMFESVIISFANSM